MNSLHTILSGARLDRDAPHDLAKPPSHTLCNDAIISMKYILHELQQNQSENSFQQESDPYRIRIENNLLELFFDKGRVCFRYVFE